MKYNNTDDPISLDELELADHRFSNDKQLSDRDCTIIEYAITFLVDHFRSDQVLEKNNRKE